MLIFLVFYEDISDHHIVVDKYLFFGRNRQILVAKIGIKYKCVMYLSVYFYLGE